MSVLGRYKKQPGETLDYDIYYTEFFSVRTDHLNTAVTTVQTGITLVSQTLIGDSIKIKLSGGTNGVTYKITVSMTTTTDIIKEDEFYVTVKEI